MKLVVTKWDATKEDNVGNIHENGLIRVNPNKPDFGTLMLMTVVATVKGGFLNKRNKMGFVVGEVTVLESVIEEFDLKEGTDYSKAIAPHRIITLEKVLSAVPIDKDGGKSGYKVKINPETEAELSKDGEPIYWKTEVVPEGSDLVDETITHDVENVDNSSAEFSGSAAAKEAASKK